MYSLVLKNSKEVIDRTSANNLEEATSFFVQRKRMDEKAFNKLYLVCLDEDIK